MEALKLKIKISLLWISFAVSASAAMIIWFVEPGILSQIITTGEMATEKLTELTIALFALYWIIPLSLAFLSQILKYGFNRWLNFGFAIVFAFFNVYYFIIHLLNGWFAFGNFLMLFFSFWVTILIAWYAWNIPKKAG